MKNIIVFLSRFRLPLKLICWFAFGSALSSCCLLKHIAIVVWYSFDIDNLTGNQLYNHLPDQLPSFECYHMLFDRFLYLTIFHIWPFHQSIITFYFISTFGKNSLCVLLYLHYLQTLKQKVYLLLEN